MRKRETAAYELPRGTETILVGIEDERLRARVLVALEACGYDILAVRTGDEALRLVEAYRPSISLLVCQLATPAGDGGERARRFAALAAGYGQLAQRRNLGVLLLADDCAAAAQAGNLVACLQQPIRPSVLVAKVRQILDAGPEAGNPDLRELPTAPAGGNYLEN
ncbi:MAG: hypothetical protein JOZ15_11195 [Acidobacteria bacterium]|nr:hypothetical protein [Acidobacteriota bacterium]